MADIVDSHTRSRMMSGIRGKNTKPELIIRSGLHRRGFRFRVHYRRLPGRPDIVLPKYRSIILVNGCFWHGHNCHLFKWPSTRKEFWKEKIEGTMKRDLENADYYLKNDWRVCTVWECAIKGHYALEREVLLEQLETWLASGVRVAQIRGTQHFVSRGSEGASTPQTQNQVPEPSAEESRPDVPV